MSLRQLNRWAALATLLAATTVGCVLNHFPDMRAQLDKLIPSSYQLLAETSDDPYPTIFGRDADVTRYYRSPLDLERTCNDLEAILKDRSPFETRDERSCGFGFKASSGWRAGILWVSPYTVGVSAVAVPPKASRGPGRPVYFQPPEAFTQVTVTVHDRS